MPDCDDCEESVPRRTRCKNCGSLVCGYCLSHVHEFAAMLARDAAAKEAAEAKK